MNDPFAPHLRQLDSGARAGERVAWLARDDTHPRGDCLPPGTAVLCHAGFPDQFRADLPRHRAEFRRHGFTWSRAAAENLAAQRFQDLPASCEPGPRAALTAPDWTRSAAMIGKELADLDLNLHQSVGSRFPWPGAKRWHDGLVLPYPTIRRVTRVADLSETWLDAWEREERDPGLEPWPEAFRDRLRQVQRVLVYRLESSRGHSIDVVVACLAPIVLAFAPVDDPAPAGRDGLRIEWRPWDVSLPRRVRDLYHGWRDRQPTRPEHAFVSYGLDVRHVAIPDSLAPVANAEIWECYWRVAPDGRSEVRFPSRAHLSGHRLDFTDRLVPETRDERVEVVRGEIDRLRNELFDGTIDLRLLREATKYRCPVLKDAVFELERRHGTGRDGYAVRIDRGVSCTDPELLRVERPTASGGRGARPGWYEPRD